MGRRSRRERTKAPTTDYTDADGNVLTLRGSLSPSTRREYTRVVNGYLLSREDAWHRAVEFLFERLAESWTIADVPTRRQKELVARFRIATNDERAWIRSVIRQHLSENFPDLDAP